MKRVSSGVPLLTSPASVGATLRSVIGRDARGTVATHLDEQNGRTMTDRQTAPNEVDESTQANDVVGTVYSSPNDPFTPLESQPDA